MNFDSEIEYLKMLKMILTGMNGKKDIDFYEDLLKEMFNNTSDKYVTTNDIEKYMLGRTQKRITEDMNLAEKKDVIEEELKVYITSKLQNMGVSISRHSFFTMNFLIERLYDKSNSKTVVDNITQYLVNLISKWKGHEFYWYIEENTDLFAPFLDIRDEKIYGFVTHKDTNPLDAFATIWYYFKFDFNQEEEFKRN